MTFGICTKVVITPGLHYSTTCTENYRFVTFQMLARVMKSCHLKILGLKIALNGPMCYKKSFSVKSETLSENCFVILVC